MNVVNATARTRLTIGTIPLTLVTGYYGHVQLATQYTQNKTGTETPGLELDSNLSSTFADISIHKSGSVYLRVRTSVSSKVARRTRRWGELYACGEEREVG